MSHSSSSRPVTPNTASRRTSRRQSHRSSGVNLLSQSPKIHYPVDADNLPLESEANTEKFERLSDALEDLDANMTNLSSIHDAISNQFNESFASFMYGLSMTMWCVDFPGCPTREAWERLQARKEMDETIRTLSARVEAARLENTKLKQKLVEISKPGEGPKRPIGNTQRSATRVLSQSNQRNNRGNEDDSYVTNEGSFVVNPPNAPNLALAPAQRLRTTRLSRIPQPIKTASNRSSSPEVTVSSSKRGAGPNLNQPPRYMRGLFDTSNTAKFSSGNSQMRRSGGGISKSGTPSRRVDNRPRFR
ncbi:DASH complex subunit Dam1-domain-containing protein [Scheffersomyces xylosifermentans]|uniref:DASH complex subunit Dam1-domain-containing protein n=1 Tax=Scheffersomyces xylosifermentans TaxID=1304137 RepID=UPI00315CD0DF